MIVQNWQTNATKNIVHPPLLIIPQSCAHHLCILYLHVKDNAEGLGGRGGGGGGGEKNVTPYLNNPINTMIYCPTTPTDFPTLYHAARPCQ